MKEKTLNELWLENNHQLTKGKINLIVAPASSGKTYWIFETLVKDYNLSRVLYLCDTSNLEEAVAKDPNYFDKCHIEEETFKGVNTSNTNITVMTYSMYGHILLKNPKAFDGAELIICDEAHNLYNYKNRFDGKKTKEGEDKTLVYTRTIDDVFSKVEKRKSDVVFLTATHRRIKDGCSFLDECFNYDIGEYEEFYNTNTERYRMLNIMNFDIMYPNIKRLKENSTYTFSNYKNIIYHLRAYNGFKYGKKCMIYTEKIATIMEIEKICENIGLKAVGIWSKHNKKYKKEMEKPHRQEVRDSILTTGLIPDDIDVLIINASYETGININQKDIELVVVNSTDRDIQIQARSRVRKNIHMLLIKGDDYTEDIVVSLDEKWLDRPLDKDEKQKLLEEYPLYNENFKLTKWTTMKRTLENSGYIVNGKTITKVKKNDTRVDVISESPRRKLQRKKEELKYIMDTFN